MTEPSEDPTSGGGVEWGGLPSPELLRAGIALLLGALASTLGAFMLGEYQFEGTMPILAGLLFGAVIAEGVVEIGRRQTALIGVVTGLEVAGGLLWAGWISAGEGLEPISSGHWLAALIGFLTAVVRIYGWQAISRARTARR